MGKITVKSQHSNITFTAFKIAVWLHYECKAVNQYKTESYLSICIASEIQIIKKLRKKCQVPNECIAHSRP